MTREEIVFQLASQRKVEQLARAVCKTDSALVRDLIQEVYLTLLTMPAERVEKADNEGWLAFLIVNILKTAWNSPRSSFRTKFTKFSSRSVELTPKYYDTPEEK